MSVGEFPESRLRSALAVFAMLFLTEAVYMRPEILLGTSSLLGSDYEMLHRWRLAFARENLFGARHALPAWNPHEVLGAPFAANLQAFPWIPTRLVLLLLDPAVAFGAGVAIAAALAALFAYLFCRRVGLSRIGSAVAGWTFACAGYFSSRVMAGHLPLLEAYPALPLLLWLVDRALSPERERKQRFDLVVLALSCTCVAVAGHPQVPVYALASGFLYLVWRGRDVGIWARVRAGAAMVLGIGLALAAWWPMLLLIGRSTRLLHLATPDNDVVMPYSRLLGLIVPGMQGWADPVELADKYPFTGFPNNSYFWDTASYIGLLPLIAIGGLLIFCVVRKRIPEWRWRFLISLGVGALVLSLPLAEPLLHLLPGTLLRSPARMLYLSTFCVAVALGVAVDTFRGIELPRRAWIVNAALGILLALHFADLWRFAHWFIQTYPRETDAPAFKATLDREVGDGRIAVAREDVLSSYPVLYDDAGGFDSIFSARFNRGYMALAGLPADTNEQVFDASTLPVTALEAMGVRFVISADARDDLPLVESSDDAKLYKVPNPAPRVQFFSFDQAEFTSGARIPVMFAAGPWNRLMLEPAAKRELLPFLLDGPAWPNRVEYRRPSSDEIAVQSSNIGPACIYVLESWDPGWSATVDGANAMVLPANGFAMAVPVQRGQRTVRLHYSTPGRATGETLSLLSLTMLTVLVLSTKPAASGTSV